MKPAILIVEQSSELGGSQLGLLDLLPALQAEFAPLVAIPSHGPLAERLERIGVPWFTWPLGEYSSLHKPVGEVLRFAIRFPESVSRLIRLVREGGAKLLFANGPRTIPAVAVAAFRCGVPSLWHLHLELNSGRDRLLCRVAARLAPPLVVACSQACLDVFSPRSFLRRNTRIIYPGIAARKVSRTSAGSGVIGVMTRIHPVKGQDLVLRAAAAVMEALPAAKIRLFGAVAKGDAEGERFRKQLTDLAEKLPPGSVEFCGWVADVSQALAGLDVLVVPSRREALARVIPEAFGARVPVVAAAVGGIPEVIRSGENGLLFPSGDVPALSAALLRILKDSALRERIVKQAYLDYQSHWNLERFQQETVKAMREILGRHEGLPIPLC